MIGLVLLSVLVFAAAQINQRKNKQPVDGAWIFIGLWFVVSVINFSVGASSPTTSLRQSSQCM